MIKVLFVCHGNICRSPMAEFIMKKLVDERGLSDKFYIESAATSSEEIWGGIGNPVYPPAKAELSKHGISCDGKRARQLVKSDYDNFDFLIGMDDMNIRNVERMTGHRDGKICLLLSFTDTKRDISDPWYTGNFSKTYSDISKGCEAFLNFLLSKSLI